ncbi:MAG TPA: hypothetical protein VKY71_11360 [Actinotalea caeni]|uniref:hypothetical protein n=1 Tax=Actinotalea caeni TaxID=1348467 RepID=UPI002B4B05CA|nr:hypothetical protein [Actinotalea caeni]HLV56159.1 hypothetical protein [Actinotalea caeni]
MLPERLPAPPQLAAPRPDHDHHAPVRQPVRDQIDLPAEAFPHRVRCRGEHDDGRAPGQLGHLLLPLVVPVGGAGGADPRQPRAGRRDRHHRPDPLQLHDDRLLEPAAAHDVEGVHQPAPVQGRGQREPVLVEAAQVEHGRARVGLEHLTQRRRAQPPAQRVQTRHRDQHHQHAEQHEQHRLPDQQRDGDQRHDRGVGTRSEDLRRCRDALGGRQNRARDPGDRHPDDDRQRERVRDRAEPAAQPRPGAAVRARQPPRPLDRQRPVPAHHHHATHQAERTHHHPADAVEHRPDREVAEAEGEQCRAQPGHPPAGAAPAAARGDLRGRGCDVEPPGGVAARLVAGPPQRHHRARRQHEHQPHQQRQRDQDPLDLVAVALRRHRLARERGREVGCELGAEPERARPVGGLHGEHDDPGLLHPHPQRDALGLRPRDVLDVEGPFVGQVGREDHLRRRRGLRGRLVGARHEDDGDLGGVARPAPALTGVAAVVAVDRPARRLHEREPRGRPGRVVGVRGCGRRRQAERHAQHDTERDEQPLHGADRTHGPIIPGRPPRVSPDRWASRPVAGLDGDAPARRLVDTRRRYRSDRARQEGCCA